MGTDTESDSINSAKTDTENGTGAAKYYALRKIQKKDRIISRIEDGIILIIEDRIIFIIRMYEDNIGRTLYNCYYNNEKIKKKKKNEKKKRKMKKRKEKRKNEKKKGKMKRKKEKKKMKKKNEKKK
ncbi:hypothetical protein PFAG_02197 [Plasmodium falciparum Santa Lucia]|uniref:Uncharacterized protein n=1 Tax=Plasmodium falciparum Santa Lucia TaxID=478859 RepID=W7FS09_PLAFA|nr:hypothetical protein PFAG_02197 [Plasmodium falciparum Santa Lucia]